MMNPHLKEKGFALFGSGLDNFIETMVAKIAMILNHYSEMKYLAMFNDINGSHVNNQLKKIRDKKGVIKHK